MARACRVGSYVTSAAAVWTISCATGLDYGPERAYEPVPLNQQDAEAVSGAGSCIQEMPPFRSRDPAGLVADCNDTTTPLEGAQSISVTDEGRLGCDGCGPAANTLWARFLFRVGHAQNFIAVPFQWTTDAQELIPEKRRTGALVAWGPDPVLRLGCPLDTNLSQPVPAPVETTLHIVYPFDWQTFRGALWVADSPVDPTHPPQATIECLGPERPTGWFASAEALGAR
jgi:hypothetical protein